jgi:predicted O-methyltransferase YrrM
MQAPLLYLIVRALHPEQVVETGLSSGYSARLLLEAIARNGSGHLTSVGLAKFGVSAGAGAAHQALVDRPVGYLVPDRLKPLWTVRLGPSETELAAALAQAGPIDLFVHDSLHQYPTMSREFRESWAVLRPGGTIASHDIQNNAAWPDFLREKALHGDEVLDHDLGAVRRPAAA